MRGMPPETSAPNPVPSEPAQPAPRSVPSRTDLLIGAGAVALLIVGGIAFAWYPRSNSLPFPPSPPQFPGSTNQTGTSFEYHSDVGNFSLTVPPGWQQVRNAPKPDGAIDTLFSFTKPASNCMITYARMPHYSNFNDEPYVFVSFFIPPPSQGNFIHTADGEQLSPQWWLPKRFMPQGFATDTPVEQWSVRKPYPHEVLETSQLFGGTAQPGVGQFFLYDSSGGTVGDSCVADYVSFLSSIGIHFQSTTVGPNSTGSLFASIYKGQDSTPDLTFYFVGPDGIPYQIFQFPFTYVGQEPVLHDGKFFFGVGDSLIQAVDPIAKQKFLFAGTAADYGKVINDFFFYGGRLFYLQGNSDCHEYKSVCKNDLYEYDPAKKYGTVLAKGIASSNILGYNSAANLLYLEHGTGDAGCSSGTLEAYDFNHHLMAKITDYDNCYGDAPSPQYQQFGAVQKMVKDQSVPLNVIPIKDGRLDVTASSTIPEPWGVTTIDYEPGTGPAPEMDPH